MRGLSLALAAFIVVRSLGNIFASAPIQEEYARQRGGPHPKGARARRGMAGNFIFDERL